MDAEPKKLVPAYVAYETFLGFITSLHEAALPDHIDKSLMPSLSGGSQSHLMGTLRFLGLIGDKGQTTDRLRELVTAAGDKDRWPALLRSVIEAAYAPIIGTLDISRTSTKALNDAFKEHTSFDGSMLERGIRFYLKALREAKVQISPHLGKRKPRSPTAQKRAPEKPRAETNHADRADREKPPAGTPVDELPAGTIVFPVYFKGKPKGSIILPANLTNEDVKVIELTIPVIKAYAAQGGSQE